MKENKKEVKKKMMKTIEMKKGEDNIKEEE